MHINLTTTTIHACLASLLALRKHSEQYDPENHWRLAVLKAAYIELQKAYSIAQEGEE